MPAKPLSDDQKRQILDAVRVHGSVQAAGRALNLPNGTMRNRWDAACLWARANGVPIPETPPKGYSGTPGKKSEAEGMRVDGDSAELTQNVHHRVKTLADLVKVCEIDTNEWDVDRWVCNKWDNVAILRDPTKVDRPVVTELYQVKVWLKRKSPLVKSIRVIGDEVVADIKAAALQAKTPAPKRGYVSNGFLFEFTPYDMHVGKFAWGEETVTNYDAKIAVGLFESARDYLLAQALKLSGNRLERVLFVVGQDVSHIDGKTGTTTAGTPMDVDTRYIKLYREICRAHIEAVFMLREVAPVDVVVCPGNHDELTSFHLGEIIAARFYGDKHVTVNNSARLTKYYEFGVNLFGFSHGDVLKMSELPLLMARENPEAWARCTSREWHIGHKHIAENVSWKAVQRRDAQSVAGVQDLFSDKGVRVRRLTSLSAHDAWHTKHGYTDRRACDSFVFHKTAGFTAHLSFNVDHFSGKGLR